MVEDLEMPLPPLAEQRRIAAILDKADALRTKRRETIAKLDQLLQSLFSDLFGDPVTNDRAWRDDVKLGDVADIASGITKGRRASGSVRSVPYLAVANVQDRHLRLDSIKSIEATEAEIDRYRLLVNDLVLTEGGDPDKLGRGALWDGSVPDCIHQNHVFRVRVTSKDVDPIFLNWLVGSSRGKRYFLSVAKQTTGIASINMSQLKSFPLLIPPIDLQARFSAMVSAFEKWRFQFGESAKALDHLFESLQQRAFTGKL
jgi:type I restriction enzyme S subunit